MPSPEKQPAPQHGFFPWLKRAGKYLREPAAALDRDVRGTRARLVVLGGVALATVRGCLCNKISVQAAALAYYSLMSLAPLAGLVLIASGFILKSESIHGDDPLKTAIVRLIHEVVPQADLPIGAVDDDTEEEDADDTDGTGAVADAEAGAVAGIGAVAEPEPETAGGGVADVFAVPVMTAKSLKQLNAGLDKFVDGLLNKTASTGAGVMGLGILVVLVVLMVSRVEDAYNTIWGVTRGRRWWARFVNYPVLILLASLLGVVSFTLVSASSLVHGLSDDGGWLARSVETIPAGPFLFGFFRSWAAVVLSTLLLTVLTACLNKFMPNTPVRWGPALGGGFVAAVIIVGNQKLAAFYTGKVIALQSLYGELGVVLVLMFSMYLGWLFLLIGGQTSRALQALGERD
jgi:membrane protein